MRQYSRRFLKMKRIYHHFEKWEDWRDGLYATRINTADEILTIRAARLLSDPVMLDIAMAKAVLLWRNSAEQNLSNKNRNRQAWLGQAACCITCGAPEHLTKAAWHRLSLAEQMAANAVADKILSEWDSIYAKKKTRH